ncbi:MAG: hypothetical protein II935_09845 [Bacteroidales bacterium]|nr:hypothetical protein [Bacteroidales bacterium]MBQ4476478.1 hypothetical protein [Bacteroidales bacterium]MBR4177197.1 hypothetical protein [Bacteroidales bacterium]
MNAIRYYSKFGHSKQMAEAIETLVGAKAVEVTKPIVEPVDTLYLGCGVMFGRIDGKVVSFIKTLTPDKVKRVVCFGSCAIIKSPVPRMRQLLEAQGVTVSSQEFTCRGSMGPIHSGHPDTKDIEDFCKFVQTTIQN